MPVRMELALFDEVATAVRGMVPDGLGPLRCRAHRHGLKVWFGAEKPEREHYEAQVIGPEHVAGAASRLLEIGFHAEHPDVADNDKVMEQLLRQEDRWRAKLGDDAVAGPFLGRADTWRRISETWPDPDLDDGDLAIEIAVRLAEYVKSLEPVRRAR